MQVKVAGGEKQKYITIPQSICRLKNVKVGDNAELQVKGKKIIITVECDE